MNGTRTKVSKRQIRRAFGDEPMEILNALVRQSGAHNRLLTRGFWGRLRWLLFGK